MSIRNSCLSERCHALALDRDLPDFCAGYPRRGCESTEGLIRVAGLGDLCPKCRERVAEAMDLPVDAGERLIERGVLPLVVTGQGEYAKVTLAEENAQ